MRRRRSKNFVKLSGKKNHNRTKLWRERSNYGRHRWGAFQAKLSGTTDRDKGGFVRLCPCLYFLPKYKKEEERDYDRSKKDTSI